MHLGLLGILGLIAGTWGCWGCLGVRFRLTVGTWGSFFFFFNLLRNQTGSAVEEVVLLTAISTLLFMVKEVWNP